MSTFSDPQDQPLCDLTLFSDGSVLGLDKTTGIYYQLNPNGCTLYVLMSPGDNLASRGVGAVIYAPTTPLLLRPIVQQLLKFRNLYAHSRVPVWFDWMNKKSSSTQISSNIINTRVPIETARWPKVIASPVVISSTSATTYSPGFTPAANTNLTVFCADTHSTRIWTIDKRCWLELDKTRRMAVVCYPVLIASTSTSSPLTSYEYVSHRQSFATTDASFPECWRYPLQVLLSLHGGKLSERLSE